MKKAFTLIEIICTLAVLSIILLIATPSISGFIRKDRLRTSTDMVVSDLRYAKMHAVSKGNSNAHVLFNKVSGEEDFNSYLVYSFNDGVQYTLKEVRLPDRVRICSNRDGSTFDTGGKLTFESQGSVSPYACTVALKDLDTGKKEYITLTIGYTRIMRVQR